MQTAMSVISALLNICRSFLRNHYIPQNWMQA